MAEKSVPFKLYRVLWIIITMLTGILSGFLLSHSVMLGRYFTWLIESGNNYVFADTFSVFRAETGANIHYNMFLWISLFAGILWTVFVVYLSNRVYNRIHNRFADHFGRVDG